MGKSHEKVTGHCTYYKWASSLQGRMKTNLDGHRPTMLTNRGSMTEPLLQAIKMGQADVAKRVLMKGEYSDLEYQDESQDGTALYWAAAKGLEDLVRILLLMGAWVGTPTAWGGTPLHAAADNGQDNVIDVLLANGAEIDIKNNNGDTPCHLAAYRGSLKALERLIEEGADTRCRNNQGNDVMREAMQNRQFDVVKLLWNLIESDYQSPKDDLKDAIPESTIFLGHHHSFPRKRQSHARQTSEELRSYAACNNCKRRSSLPTQDFTLGLRQKQSYPPNMQHRTFVPVSSQNSFPLFGKEQLPSSSGFEGAKPAVPAQQMNGFSSAAQHWTSLATPTPSEDEVDWDTSLCVDGDRVKSRLWGKKV